MSSIRLPSFSALAPLLPGKPLYSRRLWVALILFAVLFGIFLARIAAPYQRTEHSPQWGGPDDVQAAWVAPTSQGAVAYYRQEFSLNSLPVRASIQVAAPDRFTLYVNGLKVEDIKQSSTAIFNLLDIGNYLSPGRNVIAIRVERSTLPGIPAVRAMVRWQDQAGVVQDVRGNGQWRVALREERQAGGMLAWYENNFDDSAWAPAVALDHPEVGVIHAAHPWASPDLLQAFPRGKWLTNGYSATPSIRLKREFDLGNVARGGIKNAWLGIASTVPYTLIINGARGPTIDPTGPFMDTYDIGSFLFSGGNSIEIDSSHSGGAGRIAVAALVKTSSGLLDLSSDEKGSSDEKWQIQNERAEWQAATLMGELKVYPYVEQRSGRIFNTPILRMTEIWLPGGLLLRHLLAALPWIVGVLLLLSGIMALILDRAGHVTRTMVNAAALPWILADLMLCVIFLLPFDIRITEAQVFNLPVAFMLAAFIYMLLALFVADIKKGWLSARNLNTRDLNTGGAR